MCRRNYDVDKLKQKNQFQRSNSPRHGISGPGFTAPTKGSSYDCGSIWDIDGFVMKKFNLMSGATTLAMSTDLSPGIQKSMMLLLHLSESLRGNQQQQKAGTDHVDEVKEETPRPLLFLDEFASRDQQTTKFSQQTKEGTVSVPLGLKIGEAVKHKSEDYDESNVEGAEDCPQVSEKMLHLIRYGSC